jgi:hypothetical protein
MSLTSFEEMYLKTSILILVILIFIYISLSEKKRRERLKEHLKIKEVEVQYVDDGFSDLIRIKKPHGQIYFDPSDTLRDIVKQHGDRKMLKNIGRIMEVAITYVDPYDKSIKSFFSKPKIFAPLFYPGVDFYKPMFPNPDQPLAYFYKHLEAHKDK